MTDEQARVLSDKVLEMSLAIVKGQVGRYFCLVERAYRQLKAGMPEEAEKSLEEFVKWEVKWLQKK